MKLLLDAAPRLIGFAAENIAPDTHGKFITSDVLMSDDDQFHRLVHQLTSMYFPNVSPEQVERFLVLIHADGTGEVHLNAIDYKIEILAKRDIAAGQAVGAAHIADIRRLTFPSVAIAPTDAVMFCFRVGWRFGLFFDFGPCSGHPLDLDRTAARMAWGFKQVLFREELAAIAKASTFDRMQADGWFPFIELLGGEYAELVLRYEGSSFDAAEQGAWVDQRFGPDRVGALSDRWWSTPAFAEKRTLLEAGLTQFSRNTSVDTIGSVKTLYSELEGVLRLHYGPANAGKMPRRYRNLQDDGAQRFDSLGSLVFPELFVQWLERIVFASFDDAPISRNSALHGVAEVQQYTRARALQIILALDQVRFFLVETSGS